jgi:NAD(P)-dependent dehydrogenase (short-subunit alcohol dehydrogenase family)
VLVTGASTGIGRATAAASADRGDEVFGTLRHDVELPDGVEPVYLDVTDQASVSAAVERIGPLDALVNNAGISRIGAIETTTDEDWRALFEVNVLGVVRVTRAVLPGMRAAASGVIANVSSMNGKIPATFGGAYSATKFAVEALSESLLFEVEPFGIRVVVIKPGQFDKPIFEKMRRAWVGAVDSPYLAREEAMLAPPTESGVGGDPRVVAGVIVDAVTAARPGFRHVAGRDAQRLLDLRAARTDEQGIEFVPNAHRQDQP